MERIADEYCEKIFAIVVMSDGKIRFNELHRRLSRYGAKMSKPTLIQHINHLAESGTIQRHEVDKQTVYYEINWKKLKQLQKATETNQTMLRQMQNEKIFKSKNLEQQAVYTTAAITMGELYYLKLKINDILEPGNKLGNYLSYTLIRALYNRYATWLLDTCKESKENCQKILQGIDRSIQTYTDTFFPADQKAAKI
jgi:DNA-binding HxlR family transcriptional regulator